EMEEVSFRSRAYEKASEYIRELDTELADVYAKGGVKALETMPCIGASIAEKIEELLKTNKLKYYEELKKRTPVNLEELRSIEGLGPKSIKVLYEKLKIKNLKDLERVARAGKIGKLQGFGAKSQENILKGIGFVKKSAGRTILAYAMPDVENITSPLKKITGVEQLVVAGSVRRWKETIGDIDILVVSKKPKLVMDAFVSLPGVARIYAHGNTKSMIKLKSGLDVDLRAVPGESYGAALNYFSGSKDHNIALRDIAIQKGWKLNEYGLYSGKKQIAGHTEEELYKKLGMHYIEPELREMTGEIAASQKGKLPKLVGFNDIKGDLQVQTNWTDGAHSIEEMARGAMDVGLEYMAVTDHTKHLAMTRGLDERRIQKQWQEIDAVNKKLQGKFRVLKGTECDILKDGSMDLSDDILAGCDVVGAAVHSLFNLSKKDQTERIKRAMQNPHVDILFHPTGRLINKREAYQVDMDELIRYAKKTNTVMEIDAFPDRADLKDEYIRQCVAVGVMLAIDSDAHATSHFQYLQYGIAQARRGWAERGDIINTRSWKELLTLLH
ncbi:MAG: DNA polymerase/3'-5' exonuclease PolX, partial [bacterium]|nr:DNA polymerase/3'-5' exonuclease PolX [bacterium]